MSIQSTGLRTAGKTKLLLAAVVAAGAALALSSTSAKADTIIYQDTFPGSSTSTLVGTKPGPTTNTNAWAVTADATSSGDTFNADGSVTNSTTTTANYGDYLTFTPTSGNVYTLSATLNPLNTTGTGAWVGIAFDNGIVADATKLAPSMLAHYESSTATGAYARVQAFTTGNTKVYDSNTSTTINPLPLDETAEMVLNTTSTDWVVSFYYNNALLSTYTYATNPTGVDGVSISANGNSFSSSVADFTLTETPEPAAFGFFGLGAVGLLLGGRRKRA